ncbi:MAG TPA: glycosyltransferase family 2 protein [Vicinamibacterales bacterium]|nr:glycosyltransferase family 2 protein [Vicinamibacterales bacterium]
MSHPDTPTAAPLLSVVVPVYNEEESLEEFLTSIERALTPPNDSYEVVFVDDGSTDGTFERLKALSRTHDRVRVFSFRRNLGKSAALLCGFQRAAGQYIFTMDADLQDDPGNFQRMYDRLISDRADIVSGWRRERHDGALKVLASRIFNRLMVRLLFGSSFNDMNSGIKLYRAEVAKELKLFGGMHRFIPLIAIEMGYRVLEYPVSHNERKYGASKYSAVKFLTEMPDLLTVFFLIKYTTKPLHFFARIGSALIAIGLLCLTYLTILWFQSIPIGTRPLLTFGVLLVVIGGQIVFTGLLADLIVSFSQDRRREYPLKYASDSVAATRPPA